MKKYQHLERFGTTEVEGIDRGTCHIFPKLDGTNASIWLNEAGEVCAGSRNRQLSLDRDNAGFLAWVLEQENIKKYLLDYPTHILYGEWLVPHSLKTYRDDAWRNFYVFDVMDEHGYLSIGIYTALLHTYDIKVIPCLWSIEYPTLEILLDKMKLNTYLIKDGEGCGEGIVIKRYDFVNKYGRTTWAKLVTNEFKEKNNEVFGPKKIQSEITIEQRIVEEFQTEALIQKEFAKIGLEGWSSKLIPKLLNTVYYSLVKEESWEFVKKFKNPKIDYKKLMQFSFEKTKKTMNL